MLLQEKLGFLDPSTIDDDNEIDGELDSTQPQHEQSFSGTMDTAYVDVACFR